MRVLLVHPGARWSTADVEDGLRMGLEALDVEVIRYRLDSRLERTKNWLAASWRKAVKRDPTEPRPTTAAAIYHAGIGALERALRHQVDWVVIVSAALLHPDVITLMKRAGLRVAVLLTESPYDHAHEVPIAARVDVCWTHERTSVPALRAVNPQSAYLPHGWNPERRVVFRHQEPLYHQHDVVFVGSGFRERIAWFNAIDWTGIDLGLYGIWSGYGLTPAVARHVRSGPIHNADARELYRRAKIGLNLYRTGGGESLNPRAYELAASNTFTISEARAECHEVFGEAVPTFTTPAEAQQLIRAWLANDDGRRQIARGLHGYVEDATWIARAGTVLETLERAQTRRQAVALAADPTDRWFDTDAIEAPTPTAQTLFRAPAWQEATL